MATPVRAPGTNAESFGLADTLNGVIIDSPDASVFSKSNASLQQGPVGIWQRLPGSTSSIVEQSAVKAQELIKRIASGAGVVAEMRHVRFFQTLNERFDEINPSISGPPFRLVSWS